jgi:hypothetical protein
MKSTPRRDKALREQGQVGEANNLSNNHNRPDAPAQWRAFALGVSTLPDVMLILSAAFLLSALIEIAGKWWPL